MAVAQLIISALGLLWFIFGNGANTQSNNRQQIQIQNQQSNWVYRGTDNNYHYYSDYSGNFWCRVNVLTGEVSYKL